jgi:MFS transporter, DHA1 family, multidrug resistance protein
VSFSSSSQPANALEQTKANSYGETIVFLALTQAMAALAIDLVLPAFPEIRAHLGLPPDSTRVSLLITAFFVGSGVAQLFVGILADRYGRKAVLWGGLIVYVIAGIAATFAPTLPLMILARVLWGVGASAPRVVGVAMVRDRFEGARMAQTLSYVQAIFVIVPVIAPTIGKGVLVVSNWRVAMAAPAALAFVLAAWLIRVPETLPVERRRTIDAATMKSAFGQVARTRQTVLLAVAITCGFAALNCYIGLAEVIADKTYNSKGSFPLVFGVIALAMGVSGFVNGRLVGRLGTHQMIKYTSPTLVAISVVFVVGSAMADGKPPYVFYCLCMAAVLGVQTLIFPNINTLALQPLGHIAGLASGLIGTFSTIVGSGMGVVVTQTHGSGTTAISSGILVFTTIAMCATYLAIRDSFPAAQPRVA